MSGNLRGRLTRLEARSPKSDGITGRFWDWVCTGLKAELFADLNDEERELAMAMMGKGPRRGEPGYVDPIEERIRAEVEGGRGPAGRPAGPAPSPAGRPSPSSPPRTDLETDPEPVPDYLADGAGGVGEK